MIEATDIETYLSLSKDKFQIWVFDKINNNNLYRDELKVDYEFNIQETDYLSKFLDKNVYEIERLTSNFIKNIVLIIDYDNNLNVKISTKKKIMKILLKRNI